MDGAEVFVLIEEHGEYSNYGQHVLGVFSTWRAAMTAAAWAQPDAAFTWWHGHHGGWYAQKTNDHWEEPGEFSIIPMIIGEVDKQSFDACLSDLRRRGVAKYVESPYGLVRPDAQT